MVMRTMMVTIMVIVMVMLTSLRKASALLFRAKVSCCCARMLRTQPLYAACVCCRSRRAR
jgi:hypothetical protein